MSSVRQWASSCVGGRVGGPPPGRFQLLYLLASCGAVQVRLIRTTATGGMTNQLASGMSKRLAPVLPVLKLTLDSVGRPPPPTDFKLAEVSECSSNQCS
jgi:hypothetical protein